MDVCNIMQSGGCRRQTASGVVVQQECLSAHASGQLHAHPLVADNGMADARVVELALALGALSVAQAVLVQAALGVAHVLVLLLALDSS